jgi:hypothetical protein
MRKAIFLFSILALLMGAMVISAQDDDTPVENWCDEGGLWYLGDGLSLCNTQPDDANNTTMWVCGWVGAQHALGNISYELFLDFDATICSGDLLFTYYPDRWTAPPEPTPEPTSEPEPAATQIPQPLPVCDPINFGC